MFHGGEICIGETCTGESCIGGIESVLREAVLVGRGGICTRTEICTRRNCPGEEICTGMGIIYTEYLHWWVDLLSLTWLRPSR